MSTASPTSSTPCPGSSPTPPGSTPEIEGYSFVGPVDVQIYEGTRLRAGRFAVTAEVAEGADGLSLAELVLPDGERVSMGPTRWSSDGSPSAPIVLADPNVSRRHAELRRAGEKFVVTDLGSTNGTRVNGTAVREQHLTSGDEINVGSTTLVFERS